MPSDHSVLHTTKLKLNTQVKQLKPSATLLINERSKALIKEGKKVYKLGFGQSPFPVPHEVVEALILHAAVKDYLPVKGLYALRQAVAEHLRSKQSLNYTPENILIGPGSKELIFNAQLALDATLLLPSPSWVSYEPQAQLLNKKTIWLDTSLENNWCLDAEVLNQACHSAPANGKILILNYPNNPSGTHYTAEQLIAIVEIARKHEILIISDEIYGLTHHTNQHCSIAQFYPEGTLVSTGLSKWCGAGGWRLGTVAIPDQLSWLLEAMATIASETYTSVSAPIQYAAVKAYEGSPSIDQYLVDTRKILRSVGQFVYQKLQELSIHLPAPQGGFYLFPNFGYYQSKLEAKGICDSISFCEKLLEETGIALLPGLAFGRPTAELTARLAFVDFDGEKILQALRKNEFTLEDHNFLKNYCPNIYEAMQELRKWLEAL